jgi:hypothetical protein
MYSVRCSKSSRKSTGTDDLTWTVAPKLGSLCSVSPVPGQSHRQVDPSCDPTLGVSQVQFVRSEEVGTSLCKVSCLGSGFKVTTWGSSITLSKGLGDREMSISVEV